MAYAATVVIPRRWLSPGSYAGIDLQRSGVVRATPFYRVTPPPGRFGRRVAPPIPSGPRRGWGRFIPYIGIPLLIGEAIDRFVAPRRPWRLELKGPWYVALDCGLEPDCYLTAGATTPPGDPFGGCFFGQFSWDFDGTNVDWGLQVTNDQKTVIFGRKVDLGFPQRYDTALKVSRNPGDWGCTPGDWYAPDCTPIVHPARPATLMPPPAPPGVDAPPGVYGPTDPNLEREYKRGVGTPAGWPIEGFPRELELPGGDTEFPPPRFRIEIQPTPDPSRDPDAQTVDTVAVEPGNTFVPTAPPRNDSTEKTKEKKVQVKGVRAAIAVVRMLDFVSEIGDMVDAVYMSLPAKLRRQIEGRQRRSVRGLHRARDIHGKRVYYDPRTNTYRTRRQLGREPAASFFRPEGPGDQMGQYGLGGADWKIQAIWRHWDQVDASQAVSNLIANEVEDRAYGRYYGARDRAFRRGRDRPRSHTLYPTRAM